MRWMLVIPLVTLALGGCGGGNKAALDPTDESDDDEGGDDGTAAGDGAFCPPETYEEIEALFKAKTRVVNRCYVHAQEMGEVAKGKAGVIALEMKISGSGQARDIVVSNDTLASAGLAKCVVDLVAGWDFPSCEVEVEYNYAYHFAP